MQVTLPSPLKLSWYLEVNCLKFYRHLDVQGAYVSAQTGQMAKQKWPEHAIVLRSVEVKPPSGPAIGTMCDKMTAV